jgi:predicted small secreted protein
MRKDKILTAGSLFLAAALVLAACNGKSGGGNAAADAQRAADTAAQTYTEALKTMAETVQDAAAVSSGGSNTALSAADWEQALDDYEQFVDKYAAFMKQYTANPGDMALLGEYASMVEQAQTAMESISKVEAGLSGADLAKFSERYIKIAAKLMAAVQ